MQLFEHAREQRTMEPMLSVVFGAMTLLHFQHKNTIANVASCFRSLKKTFQSFDWNLLYIVCGTVGDERRCRSRQIFRGVKDFCTNFFKLARKGLVWLWPTNFLPQRSWRRFLGMTSKKRPSCVFLQTLGAIFSTANVGRHNQTALGAVFAWIVRDFAQIFRDFARIFDKSKLLGVCLHPRLLHHWR